MPQKSKYPDFDFAIKQLKLPLPNFEFKIKIPSYLHKYLFYGLPKKHWRIDYFWPDFMFAVEIDGGAFKKGGGGHNRGAAFRKDMIRHNTFSEMGIFLYRFMPEHLPNKSTYAINLIEQFFERNMYEQ